mgnify:FL=1|jgi:membrane protein required for beta-lactamase induction|tara:strand:- start:107 stop:361 length:255 start_codon:yes stop_codon:yes gene_type:complete
MEILYYAIIVYCLKTCDTMNDMEKYINLNPMNHNECLATLDKMAKQEKEIHPVLVNRNIGSLCVKHDLITEEDLEKYEVWGEAT